MLELLYPFILLLNPKLARGEYESCLKEMLQKGYRAVAAFLNNEAVGVSGFWTGCKFWCGRYLEIDNFVVAESMRGQGVGQALLRWLEETAARENNSAVMLDAYVTNPEAHRFYFREGYSIPGYHFLKKL